MPAKIQFRTNAGFLAAQQRARAGMAVDAMNAALATWGAATKVNAERLSEGTLSTSYLRTIRPGLYSRRRTATPLFDRIINRQSGLFAKSWRVSSFEPGVVTVWNSAPYSGFMVGTRLMRARPILDFAAMEAAKSLAGTVGDSPILLGPENGPALYVLAAKRVVEARSLGGSAPLVGASSFGTELGFSLFRIIYVVTRTYGMALLESGQ